MDLAATRSATQRARFVMRLGCALVILGLLAGLLLPARTNAVAITTSAVATIAAAYLAAYNVKLISDGLTESGVVAKVEGLIGDFLTSEHGGMSILEWFGNGSGITMVNGSMSVPASIARKLSRFAFWLVDKFGLTSGANATVSAQSGYFLSTGEPVVGGEYLASNTRFWVGTEYVINGHSMIFQVNEASQKIEWYIDDVFISDSLTLVTSEGTVDFITFTANYYFYIAGWSSSVAAKNNGGKDWTGRCFIRTSPLYCLETFFGVSSQSFTVETGDISIPAEDAIGDEQSMVIDVGATDEATFHETVIDGIMTGELTATAEITGEQAGEETDEDELVMVGDISLGDIQAQEDTLAAMFISKFPFSIPWDVARAVKLLAAPPETPRWEVDFMAPIAYRVGGWKGDTTIVIDMAEYEIIGKLSRWATTIGFCLVLASGTKRLIWTA